MRPVAYLRNVAVFHGIEVDVIDVIAQIAFVADQMLPIAALPDAAFCLDMTPKRTTFVARHLFDKGCFDMSPTRRMIVVARRQLPYAVQVIGQNHDRDDVERPGRSRGGEGMPQHIHTIDQQRASPLQKIHSEEVCASRHPSTSIIRHTTSMRRAPSPAYRPITRRRVRILRCRRAGLAPATCRIATSHHGVRHNAKHEVRRSHRFIE